MAVSPVIFQCFQQDQDEAKLQLDLSFASQCVPESPRGLVKIPIIGPHMQSFWFSGSGPENLHFNRFSPDADAADLILKTTGLDSRLSLILTCFSFFFVSSCKHKDPWTGCFQGTWPKIVFHSELDLQDLKCPSAYVYVHDEKLDHDRREKKCVT